MELLGTWLKAFDDSPRRQRILDFGLLTGLRADPDGTYRFANFERGLLLDRIVELHRPRRVLELGTGRGLGAFALAAAARAYGAEIEITTIDILPISQRQDYALEVAGKRERRQASCEEIWSQYLDPELRARITPITGTTSRMLPRLLKAGRQFDFVFIDAGHDLSSVAHDFTYAAALLAPGGTVLMDDFAPLEEFGLGTCDVASHAHRFFSHVEIFPSEGLVFGGAVHAHAPRGMVFLAGLRAPVKLHRSTLWLWRLASAVVARCYRPPWFPAQKQHAVSS
jgi:predicted O-methyltransferase YrrM